MPVARQLLDPHDDLSWPAPADGDDVGCSGPMIARAVPAPGVAVR